jgi:hypothetical protein
VELQLLLIVSGLASLAARHAATGGAIATLPPLFPTRPTRPGLPTASLPRAPSPLAKEPAP